MIGEEHRGFEPRTSEGETSAARSRTTDGRHHRPSMSSVRYPYATSSLLALLLMVPAEARWKPEYAAQSQEVQLWYRNAQLTDAARERLNFKNCCDHSDVVRTHFQVNRRNGTDEWLYEDTPGHMKRIPPDVIHWGDHAPDGQPTLFVYAGIETCFYPGLDGN